MTRLEEQINELLVKWDPIQIGCMGGPVHNEYAFYIPRLIAVLHDRQQIKFMLEQIVIEEMGLAYDRNNKDHVSELEELSENLFSLAH